MRKIIGGLAVLTALLFCAAPRAQAGIIDLGMGGAGGGELQMYEIYNATYGTNYGSNDEIEYLENNSIISTGFFTPCGDANELRVVARYAAGKLKKFQYYDASGKYLVLKNLPGQSVLYNSPGVYCTIATDEPFGLIAKTKHGKWYSEQSRNSDKNYHFLVLNAPSPNTFLVGLEDASCGSDWDYNDFVCEIKTSCVPEPATMALFALGGLGLLFFKRKTFRYGTKK